MMAARRQYVPDPTDLRNAGACGSLRPLDIPPLPLNAGGNFLRPRRYPTAFSLVELLTVIAIIGILSTLVLSAIAKAKTKSNQVVCRGNLRQISQAVEMYQEDARRRPRTLSRLISRPAWLANESALVCPADPGLRRPPENVRLNLWMLWGNRANATQEPPRFLDQRNPEAGSWEAELRETSETNRFSYLHAFAWQRAAFNRLGSGNQAGNAVCQLHGLRIASSLPEASYADYEGLTLRAQRDGAVVSRKIFRSRGAKDGNSVNGDTITVALNRGDYPWEFYLDSAPPLER